MGDSYLDNYKEALSTPLVEGGERTGYGYWKAAYINLGTVAGAGVLALPYALSVAGWVWGPLLLIGASLFATSTGILLGKCQDAIRGKHDDPSYSVIGREAGGEAMETTISWFMNVTLMGVATVFLVISGGNFAALFDFIPVSNPDSGSSVVGTIIAACIVIPITWIPTLNSSWGFALFAVLSTTVACWGVLITMFHEEPNHVYDEPTFGGIALALGNIFFSFSAHPVYPSVQAEMKDPKDFPKAIIITYIGLFLMYAPIAIGGFWYFGNTVRDNILVNLQSDGIVEKLIIAGVEVNVLFSCLLILYPVSRALMIRWKIDPDHFSWRMAGTRNLLVVTCLVVALLVPKISVLMGLVGGSTNTALSFVFPAWFYLRLNKDTVGRGQRWALIGMIMLGVAIGLSATVSALSGLTG